MRLRNIKGANDKIKLCKNYIENPEEYYGKINKIFNNDNPIHIEIGMGKGNFIIENAKKNPNINYIGIEKYASVLLKATEKIKEELPNLKLILWDAKEIEKIFNHDVDTLYLNFSDPWPKKKHEKRRLTSTEFLNKYEKIFKKENHIIMKTDNRKLFEYSIIEFNKNKYQIEHISLNLYEDDITDNIPTEYEMKFHNKGLPIYQIEIKK